jgi:hypothetical protein
VGSTFVPRSTQCATFAALPGSDTIDDSLATIVGIVGGEEYSISIEVLLDNPGYTHPGTPVTLPDNLSGSVDVFEIGGQHQQWLDNFGPATQNSVVVLHLDRKSGTVDAWLANGNQNQIGATATLHVKGSWRCG